MIFLKKNHITRNAFLLMILFGLCSNFRVSCMKQDLDDFNQQESNRTSHQNDTFNQIISVIEAFLNQSNRNANRRSIQSQQTENLIRFPMQTQFSEISPINTINTSNIPLLILPFNVQTRSFSMLSNVNNNIINHNTMPPVHRFIESDEESSPESESESETEATTASITKSTPENIIEPIEDRNDRLTFALAIKTYNEKNETNIINEILRNCFYFLPFDAIKTMKLTNKECFLIMNEMLKQSMKAVIIGSYSKELSFPKNDRSFYIKFDNNGKDQDTQEITKHKVDFIKATTLNTTFIFFEMHMYKFSPVFLEEMLHAFSAPEICTQLKNVICLISRVHAHKGSVSKYINSLLKLSEKTGKNNSIDFTFIFNPDRFKKAYTKTVEKQIQNIAFPKNKNYSLNLDLGFACSLETLPGLKQIISQPNTQKIINTHLCTEGNVNDLITNIYSKISQKNATKAHIMCDGLYQETSIVNLTKTFFDEKLYPSLEKVHFHCCRNSNINQAPSIQSKDNTTIKEITIKDSDLPATFLEFLLNSCKNLKTLSVNDSRTTGLSNNFLAHNSNFLLENITMKKGCLFSLNRLDQMRDVTSYFTVQSLKQMLTHFPYLKTLSLDNIILDYSNGNNETDQFISFVQNIAYCIPGISFDVIFTEALQEQLIIHIEQFKKDLDKLKETLQSKQRNVSIFLPESFLFLSIKINKDQ